MTRERLERAFYQFFCETRLFAGKEFFRPEDSRGRPMVPIYLALLTQLSSSDTRSIRRFYMTHGTTALAARQWIEEQHRALGGPGAAAEVSQEEANALSSVRIISSETAAVLSQLDMEPSQTGSTEECDSSSSSSSDSSSDSEDGDRQRKPRRTDAERALAPAHTAVSLYLVHSARSDLVKVGLSAGSSYEQCQRRYAAVYGHLDAFHFVAVENGKHLYSSSVNNITGIIKYCFRVQSCCAGREPGWSGCSTGSSRRRASRRGGSSSSPVMRRAATCCLSMCRCCACWPPRTPAPSCASTPSTATPRQCMTGRSSSTDNCSCRRRRLSLLQPPSPLLWPCRCRRAQHGVTVAQPRSCPPRPSLPHLLPLLLSGAGGWWSRWSWR